MPTVVEFPASLLGAIKVDVPGSAEFIHEHLVRLLQHSKRLPAITIRLTLDGIHLTEGAHYRDVAMALSRSVPAIVTKDSVSPTRLPLTAVLRIIPASEYMDELPSAAPSWQVLGFNEDPKQRPELLKATIEQIVDGVGGGHLRDFMWDEDLRCAEFCAEVPLGDERGRAELVRSLLVLPGLISYQGRRLNGRGSQHGLA